MQEIEVKPKFNKGDTVKDIATGRRGKVTRIWTKVYATGELTYRINTSYTVVPNKTSYNQFRANEDDIELFGDTIEF